jgi:hypothetical protein
MTSSSDRRPATTSALTDAEIRATLYFAVGVTSESGNNAYRLALAGDNPRTPLLEPADNSGYSIGTIQTDFGQHYQPHVRGGENVPRELVEGYQAWATRAHPDWVLDEAQRAQTIADLGRQGSEINRHHGRPLDATVKSHLDAFIATDAGITWVHDRDVAQIDKLMHEAMPSLTQSRVYQNASADEQVRLVAMVGKLHNQNERLAGPVLQNLAHNRYANEAALSDAISGVSRPHGDYFETGRDAALRGAAVVNALRNADSRSPLHAVWEHTRDNALTNPTQLAQQQRFPQLPHEYATVRNLFVHYDQAARFIEALDGGLTFKYGALDKTHPEHFKGAGFYAAGDDFVTWSDDGRGHARIGGAWSDVQRSDLSRRNGAGHTIDLQRDGATGPTTLLHIDPHARPFRAPPATPTHALADPLHAQAEEAVRRLDASLGRAFDERSASMAASLACLARENRLDRIDHVVLSQSNGSVRNGENVFVVQGGLTDATNRVAHMKTQDAITASVDQSLQQLAATAPAQMTQTQHPVQDAATRQPLHRMTV